jgi:hypothetical protein
VFLQEEFEDTKGVIRIRKSKKDRQHNEQKKRDKKTNNDPQNIHIKLIGWNKLIQKLNDSITNIISMFILPFDI